MKSSLNLIRNKKKKLLKKIFDDQIFQKSLFSIYALHGIKFLMDFNWIRCISETLRKISFKASGIYAKITYIVLIHMYQGQTGLLPLFLREKGRFEPLLARGEAWREKKLKRMMFWTKRAADCATRTQASIVLENKVNKVMEFLPCFDFTRISIYSMKLVKIDFSNNSIIEIKTKLTFHGVLM